MNFTKLPREIALVHEWFSPGSVGGAEQVVQCIYDYLTSKGSDVALCSLVDGESTIRSSWLYGKKIQTSFVQNLPFGINNVQKYLPLLPLAIEQLEIGGAPLVISSSHCVAKGLLLSPDQLHVSYVHTPVRYAWDQMNVYLKRSTFRRLGLGPLIRLQLHSLRKWDQLSASRVNYFIANSRFTSMRIKSYWGRESKVINPPVNVDKFRSDLNRDEFYLCLCRLVPNKRVDIVIEAFNKLKLPLIVVGDGPEKAFLKSIAGPSVDVVGFLDSEKVIKLMQSCRAYVYAGLEDFGIAPVEAMAAGAPVIAYGKGGVLDSVCCASDDYSKATGLLFSEQKVSSLVEAIEWFEKDGLWRKISSNYLHQWSQRFHPNKFNSKMERFLMMVNEEHKKINSSFMKNPSLLPE